MTAEKFWLNLTSNLFCLKVFLRLVDIFKSPYLKIPLGSGENQARGYSEEIGQGKIPFLYAIKRLDISKSPPNPKRPSSVAFSTGGKEIIAMITPWSELGPRR